MTARHRFALGTVFLFLVCTSCSLTPSTSPDPSYYQNTVEAVRSLRDSSFPSLDFLRNLADGKVEGFDVNEYFSVLTHLSMEDGYTLGYSYYLEEDFGGNPMLHARPSQYATYPEYIEAEQPNLPPEHSFSDHIQIDGTKEGFFEFTVLRTMGSQFYLYWHSARGDTKIICSQEGMQALLDSNQQLPIDVKLKAQDLNVTPVIEVGDDNVLVKIVIFSNWGGFIQKSYTISQDYPHRVVKIDSETLVEYDSGIQL